MQTISFKLEDELAAELDRRAAALGGESRHTVARNMVRAALTDANPFSMLNELELIDAKVSEFRYLLATAVSVLLKAAGKVEDPAEAERWVRRNLLGEQLPDSGDETSGHQA